MFFPHFFSESAETVSNSVAKAQITDLFLSSEIPQTVVLEASAQLSFAVAISDAALTSLSKLTVVSSPSGLTENEYGGH